MQPKWYSFASRKNLLSACRTARAMASRAVIIPAEHSTEMASSDTARYINPSLLYPPYLNPHWPTNQPLTPAESPREEPDKHPGKPADERVKKPTRNKPPEKAPKKAARQAQKAIIAESNWVIDSFRLTGNEKVFLLDLLDSATRRPPTEKERVLYEDEFWANYANAINRVYMLGE
ncbi:hypothetical protein BJY01DRAFT_241825 [Aspergillus pseudoustus]|uniref:Uncharacterized protein n=1 Tax=Aspergillus pseudoustus TaxID=1810923 RepID=A0ABR4L2V0_9EURO